MYYLFVAGNIEVDLGYRRRMPVVEQASSAVLGEAEDLGFLGYTGLWPSVFHYPGQPYIENESICQFSEWLASN